MLRKNRIIALYTILLVGLGLFIQFTINPYLQYHIQQTAFLWGDIFRNPFLLYPGGISDYVSLFLSQFFYYNWPGTIIILSLGVLASLCTAKTLKTLNINIPLDFFFLSLPLILLTALEINYKYPLAAPLKIILAYCSVYIFVKLIDKKLQLLYVTVLAIILYIIAGGISLFVFTLSIVIIKLIKKQTKKTLIESLIAIGIAITIPYLFYQFFYLISIKDAYFKYYTETPNYLLYKKEIIDYLFIGLLPLTLLISTTKIKAITKFQLLTNNNKLSVSNISHVVLVIIATILLPKSYFNKIEKQHAELDYYAYTQNWSKIIKKTKYHDPFDIMELFQLNRAQAHLGILSENLFIYPQLLGSESLFPDVFTTGQITIPASDLYFDLGYIGNSQRWINEAQTLTPYSPRILKRLIVNNLILRNYSAAEKYLFVLNQNFLYKDWVKEYSLYVSDTTRITKDPILAEKRSYSTSDSLISDEPNIKMKVLLNHCNTNRMAYDYLQAYYILNHQTGDFVSHLKELKEAGYVTIPRIFEQVILLHNIKSDSPTILPSGYQISKASADDFYNFNKTFAQYKGNKEAAQSELYQTFSNTFWYYILFDSPKVTNAKLASRALEY